MNLINPYDVNTVHAKRVVYLWLKNILGSTLMNFGIPRESRNALWHKYILIARAKIRVKLQGFNNYYSACSGSAS